jgi:hypothetical protein
MTLRRRMRALGASGARYHGLVARGPLAFSRALARGLLLLPCLPACVEIDPSYAESFVASTGEPVGSSDSSAATISASGSDASTSPPPACDCSPLELCEADMCTPPARVLFVNLDGVTTSFGNADASQDVQGLYMELAGAWEPYGADGATRQMLLALVQEQWAPFRVVVTDTRPPAPPYLMAVVTASPVPATLPPSPAFAFPDCGEMIAQDISFVFATPSDGYGVAQHANWVSSTFGRALGLRFVDSSDDIMGFGDRFLETCYPSTDPVCAAHDPALCSDDPMQQSSHGELAALLGTRE